MSMPERPTGEIAFVFTDIEGSTRLVDALGTAAWRPLLQRHRALVRAALAAHRGHEVGTEGDSFFVVFPDLDDAVAMVVEAQRALAAERWPANGVIRVRAGIHWGTGELDADGSYVGHDVHRAARVASAAHGGQVLLSESAADRALGALPPGVTLRSLGGHRLKDLHPERIEQLVIEGLGADFPPIRSLDARPNNLPVQLTAFVGRERELDDLRELLVGSRLVTLTGPGGTGKSRLALQLAASVAEQFPDGIWFVALATITDAALVPASIAAAIGIGEDTNRTRIDVIAGELEGKRVLLVLDNMEHLGIEAGAGIAELLRRLPQLQAVATSRSPLRLTGEQEYPVAGLPSPVDLDKVGPYELERLPAALRRRDPESLMGFEGVRLFIARAGAVRPGFAVTAANADDVAAIVAHLGGVPLAIELAAARIRFLTPAAIHERLEGRMDLPGGGAADAPERQRSLRGAIAWSYDLLDAPTKRLFERMSVFSGGFDVACAEAVAGSSADLGIEPLGGLAALVDQSLLQSGDADGETRFSFLEPIREFAAEQLEASGARPAVRDGHARAFLGLAQRLEAELAGVRQRVALDRLSLDHANLRAAIDWADERGDGTLELEIAIAIWRFWQKRGHLVEARLRVTRIIGRPWFPAQPPALRARAHEILGGIIYWHGDFAGAQPDYDIALATWRELGDAREIANALYNLSFCFTMGALNDPVARVRATEALQEALGLYRGLGNDRGTADVLWGIGLQHYFASENEDAVLALDEARMLYRRVGDRTQEAWALHQLGSARLKLGQVDDARRRFDEGLRVFDEAGDVAGMTLLIDDLAAVAVTRGDMAGGARLQGLSRRLQASSGARLGAVVEDLFEVLARPNAARELSPEDLARFRDEGALLPMETGVRYALGALTWAEACAEAGVAVRLAGSGTAAPSDGSVDPPTRA